MGVDVELQVPVTIILIPLSILFVLWWISGAAKRFWEGFDISFAEWTTKAEKTHYTQEQEMDIMNVEQAGLQPLEATSRLNEGITSSGIRISQYGTYGMTETKQVIGL